MPRSKRAKVVHLSKVEKKGKDLSVKIFNKVQEAAAKYPYIYVFSVDNMRNTHLKDVRTALADSRLFFGKTRVMAKALGDTEADATQPGTNLLRPYLQGAVGLIFSPRNPEQITQFFDEFRPMDYARAGTVAVRDFTIPAGTVYSMAGEIAAEHDVPLQHSQEPNLRQLGVPTRLIKGKVELDAPFEVCKQGDILTSIQTTLLKMFGLATAEFIVEPVAYWSQETGTVAQLGDGGVKISSMDVDAAMEVEDEAAEDDSDSA